MTTTHTPSPRARWSAALALIGLIALGAGCALVPGTRMVTFDKPRSAAEEPPVAAQAEIHPITFKLIRQLSTPPPSPLVNPALEREIADYAYRVGKGDILNIIVFEHEELTIPAGSYRSAAESGTWVHSDGTLYFPYVGKLAVVGLTLEEVRLRLTEALSEYIEEVKVEVNVAAFNAKRVYVTGEVREPGPRPLTNIPLTLLDAINHAGGLTEHADWDNVVLSRRGAEQRVSLQALLQHGVLTENRLLRANDIIHVPRNDTLKVFVLGEVRQPTTLVMGRNGMRLTEALSSVGGLNEGSADATGVFVIRPGGETRPIQIYQLDLSDATAMVLGAQFRLAPRDVVYVTAAPLALWTRVVDNLLPSLQGYDLINRNINVNTR
ncbi:polysaccharide biosynthesis/export family protein [Marichromatium gracile]|uniref:polysaccharide export protein n=1 Tax=Marichromatium gracile TaxID=1048 RepID=UPI001EEBE7F0|nr:polysaccharide export protein [Marichromatium gracile]MCF1182789.1 polysaccharide biosynthesis/export family protein [Marichromatium gracile]